MSRILIADDSAGTRGALKGLIESHDGWEVCDEAGDGAEAVTHAASMAPDLVVLDLTMPRMNGFQAAQAIHAAMPNIPLLLFTLHPLDIRMEAQARAAGFMGAISKSSFESILDGIETVLAGKAFFPRSSPPSGPSSGPSSGRAATRAAESQPGGSAPNKAAGTMGSPSAEEARPSGSSHDTVAGETKAAIGAESGKESTGDAVPGDIPESG